MHEPIEETAWDGPRIALVTCAALPDLSEDDRLALPEFARRGLAVEPVAWDDARVEWDRFDLVVVRSTWDYTERAEDFLAWLERMEAAGVPLWNPAPLLRWNADKRYLRDLGAAGVPVIPTRWLDAGDRTPLAAVLEQAGWTRAVVKPVVSANARDTWATSTDRAPEDEARFRALTGRGAVMVQPFVDEIRDEGEWSLIFLGGAPSHAALKRPAGGDFRVQESHGGSTGPAVADAALWDAARRALAAVPHPWLYARVDGVRIGGRFHVMELEMLEPSLFFAVDPVAGPERLVDAVLRIAAQEMSAR